ncbi:hypothetical protein PHLCEN_2v3382, partial [Hermanssonia centrifuga]
MSSPYAAEKQVAVAAVRRACGLTASVFNKLVKNETLTKAKDDKSPVTRNRRTAHCAFAQESWGLGPAHAQTAKEIMDVIDNGNYGRSRTGRFWTLDPIDGTKGFLRGEQYAVCLALIADSRVELGVIGCPNLPTSSSSPDERGCVFVAVRHQGAYQLPLSASSPTPPTKLTIPTFSQDTLNLLESVEKAHAKLSFNERVAEVLGVKRAPTRMDSQAKYGALVRGDGGVYRVQREDL